MKSLKRRLKKQETSTRSTEWSKYDERLIKAVESGDVAKVTATLKKGAIPTKLNPEGLSALHLAASNGLINGLNLLLSHGVNLHASDTAAYAGHSIIIKMLCDGGASVSAIDMDGQSPLLLAARRSHSRACQQLLHCGASSTSQDKQNKTALILACEHPCRDVVEVLLKNKADVTAVDVHGHDPYHYARLSEDQALIAMVGQAWETACQAKEADNTAQKIQLQRSLYTEAQPHMRKLTAHAAKASSSGINGASTEVSKQENGSAHESAIERGSLSTDGAEERRSPHLESAQAQHPAAPVSLRSALRLAKMQTGEVEPLRRELQEAWRRQEAAQGEVLKLESVLARQVHDYEALKRDRELALQEAHGRAWELEEALREVQRRMAGSEARVRQMQAHLVSVRENLVEDLRTQRHEARAHREATVAKMEEAREELGQSRRELEEQRARRDELLQEVHKLTKDLQRRDEHSEALKVSLATVQAKRAEVACKEVQTSSEWQPASPKTADLANGILRQEAVRKDCISLEEREAARSSLGTALRQAEARATEALRQQQRAEEENRDLLAELQEQKAELDVLQEALQARFVPAALLEEKERELAQLRLIIKEMESEQRDQHAGETPRQWEAGRRPDTAQSHPERVDNKDSQAAGTPQDSTKPTSQTSEFPISAECTESSASAGQERILADPPEGQDKGLEDVVEAQGQRETQSSSSEPRCPCHATHSDCAALLTHINRLQQQLENSGSRYRQVLSMYRTRLLSAAQGYMDEEAREALLQIAQIRQECVY
ncbi:uveal autoantigen with coiled-coil domains and ankyrin repeats isoform X3 [Electrophorus electricus]|uniref:uveal autoantigen with coiled-coil domains and ankyrin repeats isoform X3 n=1 Tax=Electrophorus electricus TaxID=8005 RepID=UPI0015D01443|nr:uveal autoantigen with coiled-coil domains and ankyrin repeats isoform X3 [Electrophorus electricus]